MTLQILRMPHLLQRTAESRTAIYCGIRRGTFPSPVKLGGPRAVGWPAHEIDAVVRARIAGATDDQIKALVARLHAQRADLAEGVQA